MIVIKDKNGKAFGKLVESPNGKIFAQTMSGQSKGVESSKLISGKIPSRFQISLLCSSYMAVVI